MSKSLLSKRFAVGRRAAPPLTRLSGFVPRYFAQRPHFARGRDHSLLPAGVGLPEGADWSPGGGSDRESNESPSESQSSRRSTALSFAPDHPAEAGSSWDLPAESASGTGAENRTVLGLEPDRQTIELFRSELERHPHFRGRSTWIQARFRHGTLQLGGCLPTFYLKQVAQTVAHRIPHVTRVVNRIEVRDALCRDGHLETWKLGPGYARQTAHPSGNPAADAGELKG